MATTPPSSSDPRTGDAAAPNADANATPSDNQSAAESVKNSFRAALARKSSSNSHVEQHLGTRGVGHGNNDTHKRQFRRKSG